VLESEDGSIGPEEARVWVSEGRLMYHKLTRLTTFASDGPVGGWLVLQNGDEIRVGVHRLIFEVLVPEDGVAETLAALEQPEERRPALDDGVAEALAALEQPKQRRPARRKTKRSVRRAVTRANSEDEQRPEEMMEPTPAEDLDPDAESD
jgi:hypothetical protein